MTISKGTDVSDEPPRDERGKFTFKNPLNDELRALLRSRGLIGVTAPTIPGDDKPTSIELQHVIAGIR